MTASESPRLARPLKWAYILSLAVLLFSGFGQMPIFKRYYLADLPGLAWTADFYITLVLHYVAATVFLAIVGYYIVSRAMTKNLKPQNAVAWARGIFFAISILSGTILVLRNLPGLVLPPNLIVVSTLSHVASGVIFLLSAATWFRLAGRKK